MVEKAKKVKSPGTESSATSEKSHDRNPAKRRIPAETPPTDVESISAAFEELAEVLGTSSSHPLTKNNPGKQTHKGPARVATDKDYHG